MQSLLNSLTSRMVPRPFYVQSPYCRKNPEVRGLGSDLDTSMPLIAAESDVSRDAESLKPYLLNNRSLVGFLAVVSTILQYYE